MVENIVRDDCTGCEMWLAGARRVGKPIKLPRGLLNWLRG